MKKVNNISNISDNLHSWNLTPKEAIALQKKLAGRVRLENSLKNIRKIAAADVSYSKKSDTLYAGWVVMHYPELTVIEEATCIKKAKFPYIPGLLSFREGESLMEAYSKLKLKPDVLIFDGQGIAHQRFIGIASHIGVLLDMPAIGSAKSRLVGEGKPPGKKKGDFSYLYYKNRKVCAAVCTRNNTKPIFVSPGHRVNFEEVINLIVDLCRRFKIPEPVRFAHNLVNKIRISHEKTEIREEKVRK